MQLSVNLIVVVQICISFLQLGAFTFTFPFWGELAEESVNGQLPRCYLHSLV